MFLLREVESLGLSFTTPFFIADTKPTQALQKHPRLSIQFLLNALRGKEKGLLMVQSLAILGKEQHIQYNEYSLF